MTSNRLSLNGCRRLMVPLFSLLVVSLAFAGLLVGQTLTGSISGIISDSSGALVPSAQILVRNTATNEARSVVSDGSGAFTASSLAPGSYTVTIEKAGFERFVLNNLQVAAGTNARADVKLNVGSETQSVNVNAEAKTIQTDSAEVRGELDNKQLSSLPIPANRNYESALILIPGVNPPANQHSVASNPGRGLSFQSNGSFGNTNTIRIDGATANNVWLPHVAAYSPGLEAIESVNVVTNSFDAQQGLAGGASVNVHIKTGSNQVHGSVFWYHTDNVLSAKPFFLPTGFTRNPKNVDNFYGATIGGPILKDRLFAFFSYEGHYISQVASVLTTVPTDAMRNGDFSANANPIYDPTTGNPTTGVGKTAFAGNQILPSRQDAISLAIQSHIPHATLPGISNNYFATGAYRLSSEKYDTNLSYKATRNLMLNARLGVLNYNNYDAPAYGDNGVPVSSAGGRQGVSYGKVWNGTFSTVYVIRPNLVFDAYFGATALPTFGEPVGLSTNVGQQLGIPGTNGTSRIYGGWPNFSISNFSLIGNNSIPLSYDDQEYQFQPNFTLSHGSHSIRFGANVSRQIIRHVQPQNAGAGNFTIGGAGTVNVGGSANAYNAYADFLLGRFSTGLAEKLPYGQLVGKTFIYSAFAQDQWIASNRVTVSYGLRWDYFPVGGRDGRGFARYDPTNNTVKICGVANNPHNCGYDVSKLSFSPSLGVATKLTDSIVARVGAGINRDPYPLAFMRDMVQNFPDDIQASITSPNGSVASYTFEQGLPTVPTLDTSSGVVALPNTYTINSLPAKPKRDYVETWNLSLEKQWQKGLLAEARYVGSRQLQISSVFNTNAGTVGGGAASQPYNILFGRTANTNLITPVGRNQYDAFQARVAQQFRSGYSVNVGYTFSKTFAYCCDTTAGETVSVQAPGYLNLNRALAGFDRPYILTISGTGQLPFGKDKPFLTSGIGAAIAGGWQLSGIYESYSGTPFTISASGNSLNAPGSSQQADRVRNGSCLNGGGKASGTSYVDATCFAAVTTAHFGTAGFNSVRGPGVNVLNASLQRRFSVSDRAHVQFKAEAFNVTNTPHFANPSNTNISNVTFNADHTVAKLNGFGQFSSVNSRDQEGVDQRYFRLGVRVEF